MLLALRASISLVKLVDRPGSLLLGRGPSHPRPYGAGRRLGSGEPVERAGIHHHDDAPSHHDHLDHDHDDAPPDHDHVHHNHDDEHHRSDLHHEHDHSSDL